MQILSLMVIGLVVVLGGCSPKDEVVVEQLGNGYFSKTKPLAVSLTRVEYWLETADGPRLVSDTLVDGDEVISISETLFGGGCVPTNSASRAILKSKIGLGYVGPSPTQVGVRGTDTYLETKRTEWHECASYLTDAAGFQRLQVVICVELPVEDVLLRQVMRDVCALAVDGVAVVRYREHGQYTGVTELTAVKGDQLPPDNAPDE